MKPKTFSISKYLPVLFLLVFLSFFAHLGNTPLFDADEGVYSEVTREMMANGNFTSIRLNGMPFFHKPPLYYWAQAASIKVLGLNEFGLRLPSAVAALLWCSSIFLFTRRFYDTRTAWYVSLFMAASLMGTLMARAATPDALVNLFLTLTLLNIYRFAHDGNKRHIYWSFMFTALGVLTRGTIVIVLPAMVSVIYFGFNKRWKDLAVLLFNPVGLMVFGLIVIPWYLGEFMLHGKAFFSDLLLLPEMTMHKYKFIGDSLPYYAFPLVVFIGTLPFSGLFLKAVFHLRSHLGDDLLQFMFIWFLLASLLATVSLPYSLLSSAYCFAPLVIIMARTADAFRHSINLFIWPLLLIALIFLIPYAAPYLAGSLENVIGRNAVTTGASYLDGSYRSILGGVMILLVLLPFVKSVTNPMKYAVLGLLFVGIIDFLIMPVMGDILQQPVKNAALLAKKDNLDVVTWRMPYPSFNVYAEMLTEERPPRKGDTVFTRTRFLGKNVHYETLFKKHDIVLIKVLKMPAAGPAEAFYPEK